MLSEYRTDKKLSLIHILQVPEAYGCFGKTRKYEQKQKEKDKQSHQKETSKQKLQGQPVPHDLREQKGCTEAL